MGKKMGKKMGGDCEGGAKYGAIIVDCPPDFGPNMGTFVRSFLESIDAELEAMIVTHEHYDHVGNLNSVQEANPTLNYFVTSKEVAAALEDWSTITFDNARANEIFRMNPNFPQYKFDLTFEGEYSFTMGNQTFDLRTGDGHSTGGVLIWHEASRALTNIDSAGKNSSAE
jgi:glyoxylase-like metal-dependent hydrolase (beta-lactamase superfamily II)